MSYFKHPVTGHLSLIVQTAFSSLGQNADAKYQVAIVGAYGGGALKVYLGDTQSAAEAAAQEGLVKLTAKIEGGDVIISIDEI